MPKKAYPWLSPDKQVFIYAEKTWKLTRLSETQAVLIILTNNICRIGCGHNNNCIYRAEDLKALSNIYKEFPDKTYWRYESLWRV